MSSSNIYDPTVEEFTNQSTVTVNHNFYRQVNVEVIVDGEDIECDISHTYATTGGTDAITTTVKFYEGGTAKQLSGIVIIS